MLWNKNYYKIFKNRTLDQNEGRIIKNAKHHEVSFYKYLNKKLYQLSWPNDVKIRSIETKIIFTKWGVKKTEWETK